MFVCVCASVCIQHHNMHSKSRSEDIPWKTWQRKRIEGVCEWWISDPGYWLNIHSQSGCCLFHLRSCFYMSGRHMGTRKRSLKNPADCAQSRSASRWCDLTLIEASWDFSMWRYGRCRCADTRAWSEPFLHILNFLWGRTPVIGWWTGLHSSPSCRPGDQFLDDRTERLFQEYLL